MQGIDGGGDHFDLGRHGRLADDVQVELVVLALASARGALVTEALGNRKPLDGEFECALACGDHARQGGGHLGTQSQVAIALILEGVDLIDDFLARLALEEVE